MHSLGPRAVLAMLLLLVAPVGISPVLALEDSTGRSFIQRLEAGGAVDVIVTFEYRGVLRELRELRKKRLLRYLSSELLAQQAERFSSVKRRVLGKMPYGEVTLLRDYPYLPVAYMQVRSPWALSWLRRHPAVVGLSPNRRHRTTLDQSLPFVNQPFVAAAGRRGLGIRSRFWIPVSTTRTVPLVVAVVPGRSAARWWPP